jgi:hypothetical protein
MKKNNQNNNTISQLICIIIIFLLTLSIFAYTVEIRKPWFGVLSDGANEHTPGHHQWLSGSVIKFAKNWYFEGPLSLKFAMLENPNSVEFQNLQSREFYASYPPGCIIPIYLISKLRNHPPTPSLVMKYNLLNHFLIALFLGLIIFFFCRQIGYGCLISTILSFVTILLELLLPAPLYWHQNVFFSDQAVILPFVLYIFLEIFKDNSSNKTKWSILSIIQSIVFTYGIMTDWLFVFVALVVYLKRLLNNELGEKVSSTIMTSIKYWIPALIVFILFGLQLYLYDAYPDLISRFLLRGPLNKGDTANFFDVFWKWYIKSEYGKVSIYLIWASLFVFALSGFYIVLRKLQKKSIDKEYTKAVCLIGMFILPCFMQVYFLRNHSYVHDFSTLKFSVVLATVPFVLIPVLVSMFFKPNQTMHATVMMLLKKKTVPAPLIIIGILLTVGLYLNHVHPKYKKLFPSPNKNYEVLGNFIAENTSYRDIVFSPNFEILINPPQLLSYTMKRIYKVSSVTEIMDKVSIINDDFNVVIFLHSLEGIQNFPEIEKIISIAEQTYHQESFYLFKINREKFLTVFNT